MALPPAIRDALGYFKRLAGYRSFATANLIQRNLVNVAVPTRPAGKRIELVGLGFSIDPRRHPFYLWRMETARDLVARGFGTFAVDDDGDPEFRTGSIRLTPTLADEFYTLDEVFRQRLYDFFPNREPFVVDIGMNVGMAALFFAGVKGWEVLGFEPFAETYAKARRNVERSGLADRIHTREAAVAARSGTAEVAFHAGSHATNGLYGNLHPHREGEDRTVSIEVMGATEAFDEAFALAGDRPLFAKIDCEGAEYEILDRLAEAGYLARIPAMVVEYHGMSPESDRDADCDAGRGAERIVALLSAHGFVVQHVWANFQAGGLFAIRGAI